MLSKSLMKIQRPAPRTAMHAIEQHFEIRMCLQECLDQVKVENVFHESNIIFHRVHNLHREFVKDGGSNCRQIDLANGL
jgi:hypothetical protein